MKVLTCGNGYICYLGRMPIKTKAFVTEPLSVEVSADDVLFAESAHAPEFSMAARKDPFYKLIFVLNGRTLFKSETLSIKSFSQQNFATYKIIEF